MVGYQIAIPLWATLAWGRSLKEVLLEDAPLEGDHGTVAACLDGHDLPDVSGATLRTTSTGTLGDLSYALLEVGEPERTVALFCDARGRQVSVWMAGASWAVPLDSMTLLFPNRQLDKGWVGVVLVTPAPSGVHVRRFKGRLPIGAIVPRSSTVFQIQEVTGSMKTYTYCITEDRIRRCRP